MAISLDPSKVLNLIQELYQEATTKISPELNRHLVSFWGVVFTLSKLKDWGVSYQLLGGTQQTHDLSITDTSNQVRTVEIRTSLNSGGKYHWRRVRRANRQTLEQWNFLIYVALGQSFHATPLKLRNPPSRIFIMTQIESRTAQASVVENRLGPRFARFEMDLARLRLLGLA